MSDFGRIPKGEGFGMVPKFALRLPNVRPGPKALYACLCTNATPDGLLWRSLTMLGKEFGVSTRQIQRWVNDLESAGLLIRMGWKGKTNRFLVIRNENGMPWAQREAVKNIVTRRVRRANQTEVSSTKITTPTSPSDDTPVIQNMTPMSDKHNLKNENELTDKIARQRETEAGSCAPNRGMWGLKQLNQGQRAEDFQNALNTMGNSMGWDALAETSPERIAAELSRLHGIRLTPSEVRAFLAPNA
ncbi:MAG: helix-turn-helix domain-containing protein [Rhodospirillaceae bacterium]